MTDFAAAFRAGQTAAARAAKAKEHIAEVLATVARDLEEATEGKLTIFEANINVPVLSTFTSIGQAVSSLAGKVDPAPTRERWICANNPFAVDKSQIRLARWTVPHDGFPCVLAYSGQEVRSHDRSGLETAFVDFLRDAWVGDQLGRLLARELPPPLENDGSIDLDAGR